MHLQHSIATGPHTTAHHITPHHPHMLPAPTPCRLTRATPSTRHTMLCELQELPPSCDGSLALAADTHTQAAAKSWSLTSSRLVTAGDTWGGHSAAHRAQLTNSSCKLMRAASAHDRSCTLSQHTIPHAVLCDLQDALRSGPGPALLLWRASRAFCCMDLSLHALHPPLG
jgi:hypothetical protein